MSGTSNAARVPPPAPRDPERGWSEAEVDERQDELADWFEFHAPDWLLPDDGPAPREVTVTRGEPIEGADFPDAEPCDEHDELLGGCLECMIRAYGDGRRERIVFRIEAAVEVAGT